VRIGEIRVKAHCVWALSNGLQTPLFVFDAADFGFSGFVR
jgi:hypothetical protein